MARSDNYYKVDLREMFFVLFEQYGLEELLGKAPFEAWDRAQVEDVLRQGARFATTTLGPLNAAGDAGCTVVDGRVVTPAGFKDAWKALYENGFKLIGEAERWGGQGAPHMLRAMLEELMDGSNTSFAMYPGLATGAAEVIATCGTEAQKELYVPKIFDGTWAGTMCLTEPHAGSDVGSAASTATRLPDGRFKIKGTKIFISGGSQDLTENIVHLVLARIEGAPKGTKGLSLFIIPTNRINEDGSTGGSNDVKLVGIEHKMGINGSATCQLSFGEDDECIGELVGTVENQGMPQMFMLMNSARIAVGIQGTAIASSAYLNALSYARDRKQGASITAWKDATAPRVSILEHADVRRMLLDMKSKVEGVRSLIHKLTHHVDMVEALHGKEDELRAYHQGQVDLLVPLVKAYGSDQSFHVCETAIQVFGGAGYLKDWPIEQYCRDAKIFSIYEGTNHIQAMDLVGRKLGQHGGANTFAFLNDIQKFVDENKANPELAPGIECLVAAHAAVGETVQRLLGWFQSGQVAMVPLMANRFLEMMSETTVGWLLLDQARIAIAASAKLPEGHADHAFYAGKKAAGLYYSRNILPGVALKAQVIAAGDDSALHIPDNAFATV